MKLENEPRENHLKRIQEEINEVARREKELREKMQLQNQQYKIKLLLSKKGDNNNIPTSLSGTSQLISDNGNSNYHKNNTKMINNTEANTITNNHHNNNINKDILDETRSEDSGFSTSSSPVHDTANTINHNHHHHDYDKKYIRQNGFPIVPKPPPQKFLVRAMSTSQIFQPNRHFNFNPPKKGVMQKFIATRGKLIAAQQQNQKQKSGYENIDLDRIQIGAVGGINGINFNTTAIVVPPVIERGADGKPIRRGYIPVEEKIQKELQDLKSREAELKKNRKLRLRQSQPDLLGAVENENLNSDDEADVEHCFYPGKLRTSKSIGELYDTLNSNSNSTSPRITPSPNFDHKDQDNYHNYRDSNMRPAVSLAQLCDLDPEEAPSSHELIAKWESLIQRNA